MGEEVEILLIFQGKEQEGAWNKCLELSNHRAIHNQNDFKPTIENTEIQKDSMTYPRIHSTFIIKLRANFLYTRTFYRRQLFVSTLDKNTQNVSIKGQFFLDLGWQTQPNISFALKTLQHLVEYYVYVGKWDEFVLIHGNRQPYFSVIFFLPFKVRGEKKKKNRIRTAALGEFWVI